MNLNVVPNLQYHCVFQMPIGWRHVFQIAASLHLKNFLPHQQYKRKDVYFLRYPHVQLICKQTEWVIGDSTKD